MNKKIRECILSLHSIGAVKFGEFTLKSGILSPIYIDLRRIISYPELVQQIAALMWEKLSSLRFDCICGVPYTAIPLAVALSLEHRLPMVMRRKEAKAYGTKKIIEGVFERGQTCLLIEDLITSGASIMETIAPLEEEGLKVRDVVVLLDREQGGKRRIEERGYHLHALLNMGELLTVLEEEERVDVEKIRAVQTFLTLPAV
jgi:uridine monophosphate synthetase